VNSLRDRLILEAEAEIDVEKQNILMNAMRDNDVQKKNA
jgi:hypothetical protein